MKCICLVQPWASLVIRGAQRYETRSWETSHRGPLLIAASKKFPSECKTLCLEEPYRTALDMIDRRSIDTLPLGCILGRVDLIACVPAAAADRVALLIGNNNYADAIPIDYNHDGLGDILVPYSGSTWYVIHCHSSGLVSLTNTGTSVTTTGRGQNARALDIDGDGRQDLVWADLTGGFAGGDAIRYRLRNAAWQFCVRRNGP